MSSPEASRPRFHKSYGIWAADEGAGLLDWDWAAERLERAHNYWVASASSAGRPHAAPIWGLWLEGVFYFSTARGSRKGVNLAENPIAVVHLESGDEVVIVEGPVQEVSARKELDRLAAAYGEKYTLEITFEDPGSVVYALRPERAFAWREQDYPESATRFTF
ncbi:MAG TPA: pyridoxamine 5'-phosphate oxidase family protein [Gaiellaceae bacterium]|nr:pyridoxamine 5'-phosphate oxidase family protein [Gaiellaceae bacterium]